MSSISDSFTSFSISIGIKKLTFDSNLKPKNLVSSTEERGLHLEWRAVEERMSHAW
jgi:hypothetical protein